MRISIAISDPWELGEALKWQPLPGELLRIVNDEHGGQALIRFDKPITYHGSVFQLAVASPRLEGHQITELTAGKMVCSALTGISDQQAESGNPLNTSHWRGGLAFTGDVEPASQNPPAPRQKV